MHRILSLRRTISILNTFYRIRRIKNFKKKTPDIFVMMSQYTFYGGTVAQK